jgi:sugar/nucleoside kinase (ribokinase family)
MTPDSPLLDLLVVGGLTIDRFSDGGSTPGGSVLHIARAAAPRGLRVGVVTSAGTEPEALAGLDELRRLTAFLGTSIGQTTTTYRHRDGDGRRLWLERIGGSLDLQADAAGRIRTLAILYAPVAAEVTTDALVVWDSRTWGRGAILQGWLRTIEDRTEVRPLPLSDLGADLVDALSRFNLLVASREDLLAEGGDPHDQLAAMRRRFGHAPTLVVTDGPNGVWMAMPNGHGADEAWHIGVPWLVENVQTVGAGDIFAGFMLAGFMFGKELATDVLDHRSAEAAAAMRVVAEVLEERRG